MTHHSIICQQSESARPDAQPFVCQVQLRADRLCNSAPTLRHIDTMYDTGSNLKQPSGALGNMTLQQADGGIVCAEHVSYLGCP